MRRLPSSIGYWALSGGDRENPQFTARKRQMTSSRLALSAPPGTPIQAISAWYHNGLYSYDVDEERGSWDIKEVRALLSTVPGMAIIATSASGHALWCAVLGPEASSPDDFKIRHERLRQTFPASARAAVANGSNNLNRERFLASDPICWLPKVIERVQLPDPVPPAPAAAPFASHLYEHVLDLDALRFIDPPTNTASGYSSWEPSTALGSPSTRPMTGANGATNTS